MVGPNDVKFGFQFQRTPKGWNWATYDQKGRVRSKGVAPTRAEAAAYVIRAMATAES